MKRMLLLLGGILLLTACRKNTLNDERDSAVQQLLQTQLSAADYAAVDFSRLKKATLSNGHMLYVASMGKEHVLLDFSADGVFVKGTIYEVFGQVAKINGHAKFSGVIHKSSLQRTNAVSYSIDKGFIKELHTYNGVTTNGLQQRTMSECADCTIPEVVVSTSYSSGGISWATWMSLLALFDMGGTTDYLNYDIVFGGGGGGGTSAPVITIDQEQTSSKEAIDRKKYMDCFNTVPDAGATCTITISTDIPVDGHPETFFDPSTASVGHTFIELYKAGSNGAIISQNFGFYPTTDYKAIGGTDVSSKVVDNAYHEYNARLTISVTPAQLQAAINTVNAIGGNSYNLLTNNCTDFALAVFNAAGGNLSIPKSQIPGYYNPNGTSTPQGLYNKLEDMAVAGNPGVQTNNNKAYGGSSHGPCN